mgnify:CR=1 FL=1
MTKWHQLQLFKTFVLRSDFTNILHLQGIFTKWHLTSSKAVNILILGAKGVNTTERNSVQMQIGLKVFKNITMFTQDTEEEEQIQNPG